MFKQGVPCKKAGHTLRYAKSGTCVECARELARAERIKKRDPAVDKRKKIQNNAKQLREAAAARGEMFYVSQMVCIHGHSDTTRYTNDNICVQCAKGRELWKHDNGRSRNRAYMGTYGITLEDYNVMLKQQDHCCAICGVHEDDCTVRLSVDHCHKTGVIRKLLCRNCNVSMGLLNEDVHLLQKMIEYLKGHI